MAVETLSVVSQDLNSPEEAEHLDWAAKYQEESQKRHTLGVRTYVDVNRDDKFKSFSEDIWLEPGRQTNYVLHDGDHIKFLIFGAGFGGLLFAINLIKQGYRADDIVIVDTAGGFGGTW